MNTSNLKTVKLRLFFYSRMKKNTKIAINFRLNIAKEGKNCGHGNMIYTDIVIWKLIILF